MGFGLGLPAIAFLVFAVYWFGYRDTWSIDHYAQITEQCDTVLSAIRRSDYEEARTAFTELDGFIGEHRITPESLHQQVEEVREAYAPIRKQYEQLRIQKEALEEARRNEQIAHEEALRKAQAARTKEYLKQRPSGYQGFTESELMRIHSKLVSEGYDYDEAILVTKDMLDYPDTRATVRHWLDNN